MKIKKSSYIKIKLLKETLNIKNHLLKENRFKINSITQKHIDAIAENPNEDINSKTVSTIEKKPKLKIGDVKKKKSITHTEKDNSKKHAFSPFDFKIDRKDNNKEKIIALKNEVNTCTKCPLCRGRKHTVFGDGSIEADLMFIGEGPGGEEDKTGIPFVGRAGKLLTVMINAMGIKRSDVYIANIIKCRPPRNRDPHNDEIEKCVPYLEKQLEIIKPKIIVTLGNFASKFILKTEKGITTVRGQIFNVDNRIVIPTYHPSFLLRNPIEKLNAWKDVQVITNELNKISKDK